ncbi:hypothetical protein Q9Q99_04325 [Curtobacterium flaccumfaciens]|nr:hypothetical protein Q9Q99_04325 [Curtobacterium flaccumfaciens]
MIRALLAKHRSAAVTTGVSVLVAAVVATTAIVSTGYHTQRVGPRGRHRVGALCRVRRRRTGEHRHPAAQHRGRDGQRRPLGAAAWIHRLQRRRDEGHRRTGQRRRRHRR